MTTLTDIQESISASGVEALLPVAIDQNSDQYKLYLNTFYPGGGLTKRSKIDSQNTKTKRRERLVERGHFYELATYLAEVSFYVNSSFAHLRYLMREGQFNSQPDPSKDFGKNLRSLFSQYSDEGIQGAARQFIEIAGSGKMHIIKPSTGKNGGFDILFSGVPGTNPGTGSCINVRTTAEFDSFPETKNSYGYERYVKDEVFTKPYGIYALSVGKQILDALTAKNPKVGVNLDAHLRHSHVLPLNFSFKDTLTKLMNDSPRATFGSDQIADYSNMPECPSYLVDGLGKFFSILINIEPNRNQINHAYTQDAAKAADPEKQPVPNEYLVMQPDISFSIVAHLPQEIAEYISQTPKGKQVPLVPLNTWASIWSRALLRTPNVKAKGGGIRVKQVPRYVLTASSTKTLTEARKQLGFYTEEGRSNEDDLFVSNTGRFNYCPKSTDLVLENAVNYEKVLEEALETSFAAGSPLNSNQIGETHRCFSLAYPAYKEKISVLKQLIGKYAGCLQSYSWDYNCILTSAVTDPDKLIAIDLSGSTNPDALSISDYLKKPFAKSMSLLFNQSTDVGRKPVNEDHFGAGGFATPMLETSIFKNFGTLYAYLYLKELVPNLQDLLTSAAKEMGISNISPNNSVEITGEAAQYEIGIYGNIMLADLRLTSRYVPNGITKESAINCVDGMFSMLKAALQDSYGAPRSNLAKIAVKNGEDIADDPHYFNPQHFTLAEFKNVYNYLGGRVFLLALKAIQRVPKKELFIVDSKAEFPIPNFQSLVKEVMPMVYILGKYTIDSEKIYEKAEVLVEANQRDSSIDVDDIKIPGSKEGFQFFPHQVEAHKSLRGTPPRFAVLDVAPGGGKTTLLLSDIACLMGQGLIRNACVLAPNGLVRNWIEDMHMVTGGSWNLIPITTLTYRTWGDERLTKLISTAPKNTIVVVGFSSTKLDSYPVVIGSHVERVSGTLEFLKKFGFEYVAIDESHKCKNARSAIHKAVKQLCVSSAAKYIRQATGTLISNKLTDVVGQAALFSSQIFRTADEYEDENSERVGDSKVMVWKKDTPKRAREQLARHCAVISFKRKEWAFMLPRPIETFIPVRLEKSDAEGGKAHQLMYDAILKETLEEIRQNENIKKLLSGKDDESVDDDADSDDEQQQGSGDDLDDATLAELEAQLNPYLQRLEQLLTDPLGDPFGEIYFKDVDKESFVSNKVLKIIERIRLNFTEFPWVKGKTYKLKDIVDHDGIRYVLMGPPGEKLTLESYTQDYVSTVPPAKDPRWQEESVGKVIVFCRYTRTVNAIYKHLPPDLKKIAVKFHGEVKNKWDNLASFKSNPFSNEKGAQILIANEQAISEGHNLQCASRLIRVEQPWAPGDLDQSASRIFRPDPTRKFKRENIYLDWVLTNNSLEVSKMGRLISKMLSKAQFDEADNELYQPLEAYQLPLIKMSLDTIAEMPNLNDIGEYIEAYQVMAHIQGAEFEEMRQTKPSTMLSVEPTKMFPDAALIENVPYIPNLSIPDRHNFGLLKLNEYLEDTDDPEVADINRDKRKLIGKPVHTEFGNGTIVNVGLSGKDNRDAGELRRITRVSVQLASGDMYSCDPSLLYLATNLTADTLSQFTPTSPWATKADKSRAARLERQAEKLKVRETRRLEKAQQLIEKEKAANAKKPKKRAAEVEETPITVELYDVIYNGFLALEAVPEEGDTSLEDYGYSKFGDYAYINIPTAVAYDSVLDFLEERFEFSPDTVKRLNAISDSFKTKGKKSFDAQLAPVSEFKNFYALRHKVSTLDKATKQPIIKVYPVVMNGQLLLNIDIATNPAIKKVLNKRIPGCPNKFDDAHSLYIKFFSSKSDLVRHVKELRADGVEIANYSDLVESVRSTNYKQGMR
jgi:hypothetical protein